MVLFEFVTFWKIIKNVDDSFCTQDINHVSNKHFQAIGCLLLPETSKHAEANSTPLAVSCGL